jgi:(2Fe-2S) ferredoxin
MAQYERHFFVSTSGSTWPGQGGDLVFAALKKGAVAAGLHGIVRVNHSGCMGQCGNGPMVAVYPEAVWYSHVDLPGAERILRDHLIGGRIVEDYRYVAPPGDNKLPK